MAYQTDSLIIGAGQAGLAMSRCLTDRGIEHVVLDRGAVAGRWRTERWASLRLLTPNWMTRLPGYAYDGADPRGFMHKDQVTAMLARYARSFEAPVREFTDVISVRKVSRGFRVVTDGPTYLARSVVVATGACDQPNIPAWASALPTRIAQVTTKDYVHPDQLGQGGVLVVGGSATGVQLAEEIQRSGRQVTLASGSHVCLPRRYRGRDILRWMDLSGILAEARDSARPTPKHPSLQLIGDTRPRNIGLDTVRSEGVRVVSRALGVDGDTLRLSGDLRVQMQTAGKRCQRLLARIDGFIAESGAEARPERAYSPPPPPKDEPDCIDLSDIETVIWATGFRRSYPWLDLPVTDTDGELMQSGGMTAVPGLYALGLPFMRRRNSTFIDGVGADARDLAVNLSNHLGHATARAA
ncbi:MAG: NAD(P)/FAD-dependent oxidoreductase [Pseudomonadota bacterium]